MMMKVLVVVKSNRIVYLYILHVKCQSNNRLFGFLLFHVKQIKILIII